MDKIKLFNGNEYNAKDFAQIGDNLGFTVPGLSDFASFRGVLTPENLESIEVYSEGGALCAVFVGYSQVTGKFGIEETAEGLDITVNLKKEDELLKRIKLLEEEVAALKVPGVE
ncbi:MAG: hypothetical protein K0R34_3565 [Herbinix sp.]|jgi:hypothetical protein|nr:hypothetical protein [Herbinix sp.]